MEVSPTCDRQSAFYHASHATVCRSQIQKAPNNQMVSNNAVAVFNCSMTCSQQLPVTWYMTLPTNGRTVAVSPYTSLSQVKSIYGIEVTRGTVNECPQGGYMVEQLFVKATQQLNLMPVQCSTVCISGDCSCDTTQVYFSKLAILNVLGEIYRAHVCGAEIFHPTSRLHADSNNSPSLTQSSTSMASMTPGVLCPSLSSQGKGSRTHLTSILYRRLVVVGEQF